MRFRKRRFFHTSASELDPEEIFLDSENIHGFSRERFEGVLERPLSKSAFYTFAVLLSAFGLLLFGRAWWLGIVRGQELIARAENNYIEKTYIEPPRGIIYDRRGTPIVQNEAYTDDDGQIRYRRVARDPYAFSHVVGYVGGISEEDKKQGLDSEGISIIGKSGIEFLADGKLRGIPGERNQELTAEGAVLSEGLVRPAEHGKDVRTTLDADLQQFLSAKMNETIVNNGFRGGAVIVFNVQNGAIRALVSAPSFDLNALSRGLDHEEAGSMFSDSRAPLFNRALSGAFAPGSIVKPFIALAALEENIISPERELYSSGALTLPNPYDPSRPSIFRDWRAHGSVDMRRAIAVSSDVYFYIVGGGFGDIKGLGIERLKSWLGRFGFNQKTGVDLLGEKAGFLPDPESKEKMHPENPTWRVGDTYHASIGQGDVLVTPIGAARAVSIVAQRGKTPNLHVLADTPVKTETVVEASAEHWQIVHEGMERVITEGSGAGLQWVPFKIAAKTGTAEVGGNNERTNAWLIGYMPADEPKLGIVVFLEAAPRANNVGGVYVTSETVRWMLDHGGIEAYVD